MGISGEKMAERLFSICVKMLVVALAVGVFWNSAEGKPRGSKAKTSTSRVLKKSGKDSDFQETPKECLNLRQCWEQSVTRFLRMHRPSYGAFVAIDPATGEIFALSEYSRVGKKNGDVAQSAMFPAASVFKIVTSAALLSKGKATRGTTVCYHGGSSWIYADNIVDMPKKDKACRTLAEAFARSTNGVFAKLGAKYLDADVMMHFAQLFGFNKTLRIESLVTKSLASKPTDKLDLARMAAGFTNTKMSPLHGAVIAAIIASRGRLPEKVEIEGAEEGEKRVLDERVADEIASLMRLAATSGTGRRYFTVLGSKGGVAVKSGTLTSRDGSGLFNTWMVGFFPADKPEIAFSALVSTGKGDPGGIKGGHLARFALEAYLRLKKVGLSNR
jgi:cell division protein FtsI/penicillin-binding protein 2